MTFTPSSFQRDIFDYIRDPNKGNLVVEALAGTGKSKTIEKSVELHPGESTVVLVFNKKNALDLKARMRKAGLYAAEVTTLHSYGFKMLSNAWNRPAVSKGGGRFLKLIDADPLATGIPKAQKYAIFKASCYARSFRNPDSVMDQAFARTGAAAAFPKWEDMEIAKGICKKAIKKTLEPSNLIDYEDMVYVPYAMGWEPAPIDRLYVDECQDMNEVNADMILRFVRRGARATMVGDRKQGIYAFRGADPNSIPRLIQETNADLLDLPITYRCPRSVTELAQQFAPKFQCPGDAPEGLVVEGDKMSLITEAGPGDLVVSRKRAPLAKLALTFIRAGKAAALVRGSDSEDADPTGIVKLIEYFANDGMELNTMLSRMHDMSAKEASRLRDHNELEQAEMAMEKYYTVQALAEGAESVQDVLDRVALITQEGDGKIQLSTVHRAKGAEADRVFVLEDSMYVPRKDPGGMQEETNIHYVALTRPKRELYLIRGVS